MEFMRKVRVATVCLCMGAGPQCVLANDPYLQELEAEAQMVELIRNAEKIDAASNVASSPGITGQNATRAILGEGMSQMQFEETLKTRFVGTYMLYEKLSDSEKQAVHASYQRDGKIMEIRRAIAGHL